MLNLYDSKQFTKQRLRELIASIEDNSRTQLRISNNGYLYLTNKLNDNKNDLFRFESFMAGNGYVGKKASEDSEWIDQLFQTIDYEWNNLLVATE